MAVVLSNAGSYCTQTLKLLHFESQWLTMLVILQFLKVIVISLWQLRLINYGSEYDSSDSSEEQSLYGVNVKRFDQSNISKDVKTNSFLTNKQK